ncbi:MAG: metalloregulator ArsR/SmtB family transcription factor [Tissierellia bacterium]|nr:metalloregulator ArsR/SmtB family transcription factor [Tissierellia bacterium]
MDRKKDFAVLERNSGLLKALGHPIRLCITRGLWEEGEKKVGDMQDCLDLPQSTVSQHLNTLKTAGIIDGKRQGTEIYYSLKNESVGKLLKVLFE